MRGGSDLREGIESEPVACRGYNNKGLISVVACVHASHEAQEPRQASASGTAANVKYELEDDVHASLAVRLLLLPSVLDKK